MKEKGILLVVGLLLVLSLVIVIIVCVVGILNFIGKIINEFCQIVNNGGDVNVDFGNVDMLVLKFYEVKIVEMLFIINFIGCLLVQNISISLEGILDINVNGISVVVLVFFDFVDIVKGVGIEVFFFFDGLMEGIQLIFDKQSKMVVL